MAKTTTHPLLRQHPIDPTTAIITGMFALIVAAPLGILMGLVFGGIGV
jgi:hypothetical protein